MQKNFDYEIEKRMKLIVKNCLDAKQRSDNRRKYFNLILIYYDTQGKQLKCCAILFGMNRKKIKREHFNLC